MWLAVSMLCAAENGVSSGERGLDRSEPRRASGCGGTEGETNRSSRCLEKVSVFVRQLPGEGFHIVK